MSHGRFESRFVGRANAGLRAAIRRAVDGSDDPSTAVLAVGHRVALTAAGRATLAIVAADYAAVTYCCAKADAEHDTWVDHVRNREITP